MQVDDNLTQLNPDDRQPIELDKHDPNYWVLACKGTRLSVMVPPYIRFLQGNVVLHRALGFLTTARLVASAGHPELAPLLSELNEQQESKQLRVDYETFFASHFLVNLVAEVEGFFGSAVAAVLRLYPGKMGDRKFTLSEIVGTSSTSELVDRAAASVINDLMYEKPLDYLKRLTEILSIERETIAPHWSSFVELKARRDLGVHNNWVANEVYLRKLGEARLRHSSSVGDHLIPDFTYLHDAIESCSSLVDTVVNLLGEKWLPLHGDQVET